VAWEVEFSDEFGHWWDELTAAEQKSVDFTVSLLQESGPALRMPHSSGVEASRHTHMRELRIQHQGSPLRVLYIFDPRRAPLLLLGGDKTGDRHWYLRNMAKADDIYDQYLEELGREGKEQGDG